MHVSVSRANQALVVPDMPGTRTMLPDAKELLPGKLVCRHGLRETLLLRHMGFAVPNPILLYYDWCGGTPYHAQIETVRLLTENPHAYVLNDMGCVDADTEYLSRTGWKRIADYTDGEVAQYWPDQGHIEFVKPTAFLRAPCAEMIRFKTTRDVDQLLSPEHRVLLDCGLVVSANNIEQAYGPRNARLLKFRTTFTVSNNTDLSMSNAQIRLQVAVNADAYMPKSVAYIRLKKQRKIERLRKLLVDANVPYKEVPCAPVGFVRFTFVPPTSKGFTVNWWAAAQHQLEVIADEAVHWDGSARKAKGRGFYSKSKADADFIQYAFSASGCRASLTYNERQEYAVHAAHGKTVAGLFGQNGKTWRKNIWREPTPDGFKYCFMVPSTFLLLRRSGCIFATGNTGKTKTALWAWDALNKGGLTKKLIVVAPLNTLALVWAAEVFATMPERTVQVLHGSKEARLKQLEKDVDIYLINHDGLKVIANELLEQDDITCLVIDELHTYRNLSGLNKLMRRFAKKFQQVWGMTGTPMPREPTDVWGQAIIVTPHTVPVRRQHAKEMLMIRVSNFVWKPRPDAIEKAFAMLQPSVRFTLDDVVELPPVIERTIDVEFTAQQKEIYKKVANELAAMVKERKIVAANAGVAMSKLLQVAGGWVYTHNPEFVQLDATPRISTLIDLVTATKRKAIVLAPYRHTVEGIAQAFDKHKEAEFDYCLIHGDVADAERTRLYHAFQNSDKFKVLLAHPGCMKHGLTLTAADTVIWYLPVTSLETYIQANARIRRIGQGHKQQIIHLQGSQVERRIYKLLQSKHNLQMELLEMLEHATEIGG